MKIKKIALFFTIIAVLFSAQFIANNPKTPFSSQPSGWPNEYTSDSLNGMISKFHQIMIPAYLSTHDYARILSYASMAYVKTAYDLNGGEISGRNAFSMVVSDISNSPAVGDKFPFSDKDILATKSYNFVREIYRNDNYNNVDLVKVDISSDYLESTERDLYSYKPPLGHNSEVEQSWGNIKTIGKNSCKIGVPPVKNYIDLVSRAAEVDNIMANFQREDMDKYSRIMSLIVHFTGAPVHRNEPSRLIIKIIQNIANDSNLPPKLRDEYIRDSIIAVHNAHILSWYGKYHYNLIHPISLLPSRQITSALPQGPSYPSEFATIGSAIEGVYSKYELNTPVRLEIMGTVTQMATTRVYKSMNDFVVEFSELPILTGYNYLFDLDEGYKLGKCVSGIYNEKI